MALVLASASPIRRMMLEQAGVAHEVVPAEIDEAAVHAKIADAAAAAEELARAKAIAVSTARRSDWVIGSDSIVSIEGRSFAKPRSREEAAEHLRVFSGKPLRLTSAVALARNGSVDWSRADLSLLQVRRLSDQFIDDYLQREWPAVGGCVGVFRMEGRGVQLFDSVEGSHFTILGMPLIPLLAALRQRGLLAS